MQLSFVFDNMEKANYILMTQFGKIIDLSVDIVELVALYFINFSVGLHGKTLVCLLIHCQRYHWKATFAQVRKHFVILKQALST